MRAEVAKEVAHEEAGIAGAGRLVVAKRSGDPGCVVVLRDRYVGIGLHLAPPCPLAANPQRCLRAVAWSHEACELDEEDARVVRDPGCVGNVTREDRRAIDVAGDNEFAHLVCAEVHLAVARYARNRDGEAAAVGNAGIAEAFCVPVPGVHRRVVERRRAGKGQSWTSGERGGDSAARWRYKAFVRAVGVAQRNRPTERVVEPKVDERVPRCGGLKRHYVADHWRQAEVVFAVGRVCAGYQCIVAEQVVDEERAVGIGRVRPLREVDDVVARSIWRARRCSGGSHGGGRPTRRSDAELGVAGHLRVATELPGVHVDAAGAEARTRRLVDRDVVAMHALEAGGVEASEAEVLGLDDVVEPGS
jgi:hypothetical protein